MNPQDAPTNSTIRRIEHFKFNLDDKVLVREIQRPGVVEILTVDCLGPQYRVMYWDNGDRKTVWLKADELELRSPPTP